MRSQVFLENLYLLFHDTYNDTVWVDVDICALEITVTVDLSDHVESYSSNTKRIISPLPQFLWPPNLAGLLVTIMGSHS